MSRTRSKALRTFAATAALALVAGAHAAPAAAQGHLMPPAPERGVAVEFSHPDFKDFDVTAPTSVWFISGRLPLTSRIAAVADVPFAYAEFKGASELGSSTVLGNPYLGVEFAAMPSVQFDLGVRAPLTSADEDSFADVVGFLADMQRAEAFLEDVVPVSAGATYMWAPDGQFAFRGRGGVTTLFATGDNEDDTETFVDYGVFGTYTQGIARFGAGLSGRWLASEDDGSFSDRSLHQAGLTADVQLGPVRPGVTVRIPVDSNYRDVMGSSIGLYLQVPLR